MINGINGAWFEQDKESMTWLDGKKPTRKQQARTVSQMVVLVKLFLRGQGVG